MSGDASKVPPERLLRMQAACARRDDPSSGRTDGRTGTAVRRSLAAAAQPPGPTQPPSPSVAGGAGRGGGSAAVSVCSWRARKLRTA